MDYLIVSTFFNDQCYKFGMFLKFPMKSKNLFYKSLYLRLGPAETKLLGKLG